ncbi:nucleoside phosphorylase [Rhodoblastus sp.]|uniref:nucleoside phosphorylase n=1 Tax=Rhodoblastus sp. TaxID=1962975 RepID=UPI0035AE4BCF
MKVEPEQETRLPPILRNKRPEADSVFTPEALLREARRQKGLQAGSVPEICILDPDGDIVAHLVAEGRATRSSAWACYHTDLHVFDENGQAYGIVGQAVGAAFAVLVAEQLFASGCRLLISIASAGRIAETSLPSYFVVDRALRDEGTSYHYLPPADYSLADARLVDAARDALRRGGMPAEVGATWTTDAPYRETATAIDAARSEGVLAVEMEAAALCAFASARRRPVICIAHVTNEMGQIEGDFEKGAANGASTSLEVIDLIARGCHVASLSLGNSAE